MTRHHVPEWYIRGVYAEHLGEPGSDQYAKGVDEFDDFLAQVRAETLRAHTCAPAEVAPKVRHMRSTAAVPTSTRPAIRWFVWAGGQKIRHTATMRGTWPGWDAECVCGWSTSTGGATRSYIKGEVWQHKLLDHDTEGTGR